MQDMKLREWEAAEKWYVPGEYQMADEEFKAFAERWWDRPKQREHCQVQGEA
jgi:hypothetical protein